MRKEASTSFRAAIWQSADSTGMVEACPRGACGFLSFPERVPDCGFFLHGCVAIFVAKYAAIFVATQRLGHLLMPRCQQISLLNMKRDRRVWLECVWRRQTCLLN